MDINDVIMEMDDASLKDEWLACTVAHIERVKKYGRKIGITGDFNDHDVDKLNEFIKEYGVEHLVVLNLGVRYGDRILEVVESY